MVYIENQSIDDKLNRSWLVMSVCIFREGFQGVLHAMMIWKNRMNGINIISIYCVAW